VCFALHGLSYFPANTENNYFIQSLLVVQHAHRLTAFSFWSLIVLIRVFLVLSPYQVRSLTDLVRT